MMQNLLEHQYQLIKESRAVVLDFMESKVQKDMFLPLSAFNEKSICFMMVHVANTYIAWINNFVLGESKAYIDDVLISDIDAIKEIFMEVDGFMELFCVKYGSSPIQRVEGYKWADRYIETDSYAIFSHVITHEFHHKGQSMTMSRILGHTPPDTDIMRF